MKISNALKKKINKCVVRIIAEDIGINWNIPYLIEEPAKGQGTGFFINSEGHILTCAHVVNGAKKLYIEIPHFGSEKYECSVVSICPDFDVAIIKCDKYKSKEYLKLGNSDKLQVGMEVQVVGFPVSLKSSTNNSNNLKFTIGIIKGQQNGKIETDSAINPGNSGGPLFCNNEVIGINSMKMVGEALESIGYAVPINNYKIVKDDMIKKNQIIVNRPNLLINYNNTDKAFIKQITNVKIDNGIMVTQILKGSPFEKTAIKEGSIIYQINDIKIDNYGLTSNYKWIGTNININILLDNFKNNEEINIKYSNHALDLDSARVKESNKYKKLSECKIKLEPFISQSRTMYPVFEDIPYIILGGMIFMNFCSNHLLNADNANLNILCAARSMEELIKPRVILTFIFPNTTVNILNNLKKDNFINKINDITVTSIKELQHALKKPLIINKKEYIKFEADNEKFVIMTIDEIVKQDLLFSDIYKYPLNEFHTLHEK